MESKNQTNRIETLPFFKTYGAKGEAVIDIDGFWEWISDGDFALMNDRDLEDRREAFEEHERGESVDLKDAVDQW
jgi:hypothetical protein